MSWMYGTDWEYADSRLRDTVVRYKDRPFFVDRVSNSGKVLGTYLDAPDVQHTVPAIEMNLKPVPLGYCNYNGRASYLSRAPMRHDWRQGLRRASLVSSNRDTHNISWSDICPVILNDYPSYSKCLSMLAKVRAIAWSRSWAMDKARCVHYKGYDIVGAINTDGVVILTEEFKHLEESLQESL